MKPIHWLLVINIALAVVMLVVVFNGNYYEPGVVHPEYSSMLHSSGSILNQPLIKWIGLLFGICILLMFSFALLLGTKKKGNSTYITQRKLMVFGIITYLLIFSTMVVSYWNYEQNADTGSFLGFPYPTALMLFAFGFAPLIFTLPFIINYNKWILTPADRKEFEQILSSKRADLKQKEQISRQSGN